MIAQRGIHALMCVICGISTGHTYERAILQEWFRRCEYEPLSPALCSKMASKKVMPADALRSAIMQALRRGNSQVGDSLNLYTSTRAHARAHTHAKRGQSQVGTFVDYSSSFLRGRKALLGFVCVCVSVCLCVFV